MAAVGKVVEFVLAKQEHSLPLFERRMWVNLLARFDERGELTPDQRNRYYEDQVEAVEFEYRSRIRQGDPMILKITTKNDPTATGVKMALSELTFALGQRRVPATIIPLHDVEVRWRDSESEGWYSVTFDLPPGRYDGTFLAGFTFYRSSTSQGKLAPPRTFDFAAQFEILPADTSNDISVIDAPLLRQKVEDALYGTEREYLLGFHRYCTVSERAPCQRLILELRNPAPTAAAFDVLVEFPDRTVVLAYLWFYEASSIAYAEFPKWCGDEWNTVLRIILRPSPSVARRTLGLTEIWGGELVFEPGGAPYPFHTIR